jgi:hypothetical protein
VTNTGGFRVATPPMAWLEYHEWYFIIHQCLGGRFPGWCIEASMTAENS